MAGPVPGSEYSVGQVAVLHRLLGRQKIDKYTSNMYNIMSDHAESWDQNKAGQGKENDGEGMHRSRLVKEGFPEEGTSEQTNGILSLQV